MNAEVVNGPAQLALEQARPAFRLVDAPAERERITEREYLRGADFRRFAEPQFIDADGDGVFLENRIDQRRRVQHRRTVEVAEQGPGNQNIRLVQREIALGG